MHSSSLKDGTDETAEKIVNLANQLALEVFINYVEELTKLVGEELTNEGLSQLEEAKVCAAA